jgi:hypothetical protein
LKTGKNKSNRLLTLTTFYAVFQAAANVGQCEWMVNQLFVQLTSGLVENLPPSETLLKQLYSRQSSTGKMTRCFDV